MSFYLHKIIKGERRRHNNKKVLSCCSSPKFCLLVMKTMRDCSGNQLTVCYIIFAKLINFLTSFKWFEYCEAEACLEPSRTWSFFCENS